MNLSALKAYTTVNFNDANAIVKKEGKNKIVQNGTYKGPLSAMVRSKADKIENNAVRDHLLRSLAKAFGATDGYTLGKAGEGTRFSVELLDSLERRLGSDIFKRSDFGITKEGIVDSGKPLTQRRIQQIMTRVKEIEAEELEKSGLKGREKVAEAIEKLKIRNQTLLNPNLPKPQKPIPSEKPAPAAKPAKSAKPERVDPRFSGERKTAVLAKQDALIQKAGMGVILEEPED